MDFAGAYPPPQNKNARARACRRLASALCASICVHACFLSLQPGGGASGPQAFPAAVPVVARIADLPAADPAADTQLRALESPIPARDERVAEAFSTARRQHSGAGDRVAAVDSKPLARLDRPGARPQSPTLQSAIDTTWYSAREVDVYPRAAVPVRLTPPEAATDRVERILLWLRIDESGAVVEVGAGESGIPAVWLEAARKSLLLIRFEPARKDERPVRSRLLLSVSFAAAAAGIRD